MKTYLIRCETTGLIKIGKANNVKARLSTMQTGSASELTLVHTIDGDIEKDLHKFFAENRVKGEWFKIEAEDIISISAKLKAKKKTGGAEIKHKWMHIMPVGAEMDIPNDLRVDSFRSMAYAYGLQSGKKFSIKSKTRKVIRVK